METIDLADLQPDPQNANIGTERGDAALARSIEQYGLGRSILVDRDNVILAGNKTHAKAGELGFTRARVVETEGDELVVVRRKDLRHGTAEAVGLALADNRAGELNLQWDFEVIEMHREAWPEAVEWWFPAQTLPEVPPPKEDEAEALRAKWSVQLGDLWLITSAGGEREHRLLCGDATSEEDVARLLDESTPNLMVTDPPYGVEYDAAWRNEAAAAGYLTYAERRTRAVPNDTTISWVTAYDHFPGNVAYMWSPGGDPILITGQAVINMGFEIRNQIIWAKRHFPVSRGHYTYQHEPLWYAVRKGATASWIGPKNASTVWDDITLDANVAGGHSTQKPLECMQRPIRHHEGDVYDPFVGSGTTLVAAECEARTCYAMDIDPAYVAVTLERAAAMQMTPRRV